MLSLIVAVARNGAIGRKNGLLWHIAEDLKYFKRTTLGHPVIMGRKTFDSIGRPLPGRENIVVTRQQKEIPGVTVVHDPEEAVKRAAASAEEFFVIGGGDLYRQTFDRADRLYVTRIEAQALDADTFFPEIGDRSWRIREEGPLMHDAENGLDFRFVVYERKQREEHN